MLKTYLKQIADISNHGDATEISYYDALKELLKEYADSVGKKDISITTIPRRTEGGNPDFRVWDGKQHITGYIEAKAPTVDDLDSIQDIDQLKRYRHTFPNLILTNFLEFRLYRNEKLIEKVLIGRPIILNKIKTTPPVEKEPELLALFEKFFSFSIPKVYDARTLAIELAKRTRFLKDEVIAQELREEEHTVEGLSVSGFYKAFKDYLISTLTDNEFSDLYAQTITYGLFAARTRSENEFSRKLAFDNIPQTIGILRDVFRFISLEDVPQQMKWIIDDISEVLSVTDTQRLLQQYFHEGKGDDPIVHFYETFLAVYDPKIREKRGVYYTPEPVVSYIIHSLHCILKEKFNISDGFASRYNDVTVLDPAAGTLTFLAEASKLAVKEFVSKYGDGGKEEFIKKHVLQNFYAFELMMAPYAVGHLKMSFLLEGLGYRLQQDDRVKLYLTNTLDMKELEQTVIPILSTLSKESHLAGEVKKKQPILVILGNPPYSVRSVNKSDFIEKEMELYKKDVRHDERNIQHERNIQPLSDDYIKFIRFAQWKIDNVGKGIIGMITNNSYLSGLIHRGMRKKLLESFNDIYILNLHGNSHIGEKCPDGSKDENVFDIMQGVSIALFIKNKEHKGLGNVFYYDKYGLQEGKYNYLRTHEIKSTEWEKLQPSEPYYFFVPKDFSGQALYDKFWSIQDIFNQSSSGMKTHRDHFVVAFNVEEIKQRMRTFTSDLPDEIVRQGLNLNDTHDFKLKEVRLKLKKEKWIESIIPYLYRPFDNRYICYRAELIDRDRHDVMQHFAKKNVGLAVMRQYLYEPVKIYNYIFCVDKISDTRVFISNRGAGFVFPLYLYPLKNKEGLFEVEKIESNIKSDIIKSLVVAYKKEIPSEEIFHYIYAVLYSNIYREKYAEFLKIDFPRIPFTKDYKLFQKMSEYGNRLVDLHLLKSPELDKPAARFQGKGDSRVIKLRYDNKAELLYINETQYFEGIKPEVFEYQIGGYQVCEKWLKDRKDRTLTLDEIQTYCRIVTSLQKTISYTKAIDEIYENAEQAIIQ